MSTLYKIDDMGKRIFVSYSHVQADWVLDRLYPVLSAWCAEVLIDIHQFQAGVALHQQMDEIQDQAEIHLLILSPEYLASAPCIREMERAIATDPFFTKGLVLPVVRGACTLPKAIKVADPVHVELIDDSKSDSWDRVTAMCGADLGVSAAEWLKAREQVRDAMLDGRSVNLVVFGSPNRNGLLAQLARDLNGLAVVDLESGATVGRQSLITEILRELGMKAEAQKPPNDLRDLHHCVMGAQGPVRLAFRHFDVLTRKRANNYKEDFFSALKHLVEKRKLVLFIESHAPFATLLPASNSLSQIQMKSVELRGRTP